MMQASEKAKRLDRPDLVANAAGNRCVTGRAPGDGVGGAGYDAVTLAPAVPSAMLFVPSKVGVSHNEAEFARPDHRIAVAEALARALA